ncbi:MAG: putative small secreted protein [Paraglaciecola sp.]|jgi:predicted small secreted protein
MKTNVKSLLSSLLLVSMLALGLSACATVEGVGKDLESAGEAVQKAVKD